MKNCAYAKMCKGVCSCESSCVKANQTEDEYWEEIQNAMSAKARLDRIKDYISRGSPKIDIIKKWCELQ